MAHRWRGLFLPAWSLVSCASPAMDAQPAPVAVQAAPPASVPDPASTAMTPEQLMEQLAAISVRTRLPDVASRTALNAIPLAQVAEAIERADADMFVSYVANGADTFPDEDYTIVDDGHYPPYPNVDSNVSSGGLDGYAATTRLGYAPGESDYVLSVIIDLEPLPDRTPGLVWSAQKSALGTPNVTFVSVDGETYSFDLKVRGPSIDRGVAPVKAWPPIVNPAFGRTALSTKRREPISPLAPLDDAFAKCADQAWSRAKRAMTPEQRAEDPLPSPSVIRSACANPIAAWERSFKKNVDASVASRTALVEKAKARVASLGLAR